MGLLDDIDSSQFQDSGGLFGRLLSSLPQANASQSGSGTYPQESPSDNSPQPFAPAVPGNSQAATPLPDFGTRLGAGLQGWTQTPTGSPFAALANGINAFNNPRPAGAADASFIGPPAPASVPAQSPNFGDRLGAAVQSWAQTPVGSPFAALANGITGFNTGQTIVSPATAKPTLAQTSGNGDQTSGQTNAVAHSQTTPAASAAAMNLPIRRLAVIRTWR